MSLKFKYIPLTFLKDENQIKEQIKNTVILKYLFDKYNSFSKLENLIVDTQYGYNASALKSGANKFLRISDITDGKVNWENVPYCDCSDEETYLLKTNDLLIARTGGTTGKSFIIENPPEKSIFAGYLIRIRANEENKAEYLNLFLNSYVYWSQIMSINKGEFRPSVNATKLKNLIVPKVDISIQEDAINISKGKTVVGYEDLEIQISKALKDYEKSKIIIKQTQIQKENITHLKQSILQEAIQGKLTEDWRKQNPDTEPASELLIRIKAEKEKLIKEKKIRKEKPLPPITQEEIPFKLPDGWVWCRFKDLVSYRKGKKPNVLVKSKSKEYSIPYIDIAAFERNQITQYTNDPKAVLCNENNILLVWDGSRMGLVGTNAKGAVGSTLARIDLFHLNKEFLFNLLKSKFVFFNSNPKQAGLPHMNGPLLDSMVIGLPPLSEQKAIVEKVENLMQKVTAMEEEINKSEQNAQMLMQAVLKEAFEGKKGEKMEKV